MASRVQQHPGEIEMAVASEPAETPDRVLALGAMPVSEAVKFSGLSRTRLYSLMESKGLAYIKVGKRRLVLRQSLLDLMKTGLPSE
jgi:hypothetical protein